MGLRTIRIERGGFRQWARTLALAGGCAALAGCGSDFAADAPETAMTATGGCGPRLGCATEHNIATLAARPSDLAVPRKEQPRDSKRREAAIAAYQPSGTRTQSASTAGTFQEGGSR